MKKKKVLVTTAIDYANDVVHIGHAYEKILADCYARYFRMKLGDKNVGFVTGTDEHGTTNEKAAITRGISTLDHVNEISLANKKEMDSLNISYDRWFRTIDEDHKRIATDFFKKSYDNGDIYKDTYEGLYCEGCEAYKTLTELNQDGQCSLHPTRQIQRYSEENYFFRWSKYAKYLEDLINTEGFVLPQGKRREMLAFVKNGIEDIPVTRPKYKLDWGITCPIDEDQVIYVWFDALINYYTFGSQNNLWDADTYIIHFVGKDIARWHTLLWPAMLKSAGYNIPDTVYVHGFINLNGEKISKSKGNVIRPSDLVEKYGADAIRYYFLRYGPIQEDVDISITHLNEVYNGELANGLGNTVSRILKLAQNSKVSFNIKNTDVKNHKVYEHMDKSFRVDLTLQEIWQLLGNLDKHINENSPWKIEDKDKLKDILEYEINQLNLIVNLLLPFIPNTVEKIRKEINNSKIVATEPLFPRIKN